MSSIRERSRSPLKQTIIQDKSNGHSSTVKKTLLKQKPSYTVQEIIQIRNKNINPMMQTHYKDDPIKITRGSMQYLYTEDGQQYLDCVNNVAHVGHCNPKVTEKICEQMNNLNTNSRYLHDEIIHYTKGILQKLPPELCVITFVNSGSEANDLALQMAQIHTKNTDIVCVDGAYHGHTKICMEISPYRWNQNFVKPDYITITQSPCQYRGKYAGQENACKKYAEDLKTQLKGKKISTFISEGLQSCAGQVIPPKGYFKEMYKVVREHGGVCIMDEVQSGMGRVGDHFWAFQLYDVVPDILVYGKSMGNGFPVAAVVTSQVIADSFKQRGITYFNTYAANPVAMAASNSVLDYIIDNDLQKNAKEVGDYINQRFHELMEKYQNIGDVRGYGLFQGMDIVKCRETKEPYPEMCERLCSLCKGQHVFLNPDGVKKNIIKVKPPIIFNKENVDTLIKALENAFEQIQEERKK